MAGMLYHAMLVDTSHLGLERPEYDNRGVNARRVGRANLLASSAAMYGLLLLITPAIYGRGRNFLSPPEEP
jgi:hypothetical protein